VTVSCAVSTAVGAGGDSVTPRRLALKWLRADLSAWMKRLDSNANRVAEVSRQPGLWRNNHNLSSVRNPGALSALSDTERAECQALESALNRALEPSNKNR
jgi:hypothetical protein